MPSAGPTLAFSLLGLALGPFLTSPLAPGRGPGALAAAALAMLASVALGRVLFRRAARGAMVLPFAAPFLLLGAAGLSGCLAPVLAVALAGAPALAQGVAWGLGDWLGFVPLLAAVAWAFGRAERRRPPSLVASSDRRLAWALTLVLALGLVWLRYRVDAGLAGGVLVVDAGLASGGLVAGAALGGVLALTALFVASVAAVRGLFALFAGLEPKADFEPGPGAQISDLGVGEGLWAEVGAGASPYRRGEGRSRAVRGSVIQAQRSIVGAAALEAGLLLGGSALAAPLIGPWVARGPGAPVPPPAPPSRAPAPPAAPASLSWYPSSGPTPLLFDLNDDGVDDMIGLRWNALAAERPLAVSAVDGATFRALWQTPFVEAQWGDRRLQIARSGASVFVSDSAGFVHTYDLGSGRERAAPVAAPADGFEFCAAPEGPARIWVQGGGPAFELGRLVDAEGAAVETKRPAWCVGRGYGSPTPPCEKGATGVCRSQRHARPKAPGFLGLASFEDGDVGVTYGRLADRGEPGRHYLAGFDPRGGALRWERPLAPPDEALHHDSRTHVVAAGGRLFATSRRADGAWALRAYDGLTGAELWSKRLEGSAHGNDVAQTSASEARLYVTIDGALKVFDARSGVLLGQPR